MLHQFQKVFLLSNNIYEYAGGICGSGLLYYNVTVANSFISVKHCKNYGTINGEQFDVIVQPNRTRG